MAYIVNISARAQRDLTEIYRRINASNSEAALKWYRGFKLAIFSLEEKPGRCPLTPENDALRHLLYGHKPHIYRAIFRVVERLELVEVLHIRHGVWASNAMVSAIPAVSCRGPSDSCHLTIAPLHGTFRLVDDYPRTT
jgi:plasmid stabilization system protein ParE